MYYYTLIANRPLLDTRFVDFYILPNFKMKYALVALALAASVRAQTRDDIPECAIPCIDDAITSETSCDTTDFSCACANIEKIQGAATGCVLSDCGADVALSKLLSLRCIYS